MKQKYQFTHQLHRIGKEGRLAIVREKMVHPFEAYLKEQELEAIRVSIEARVRYLTVWNATRGNPILSEQAQHIRQAVYTLSGVAYNGPIAVIQEQSLDQLPTLLLRKITRRQSR